MSLVGAVAEQQGHVGRDVHGLPQGLLEHPSGGIGITIQRDIAQFIEPRRRERLRPDIGIFHRVQLDEPGGIRHVVGIQCADVRTDQRLDQILHRGAPATSGPRYSADRAWAVSPSPRASTEAIRDSSAEPAREAMIRLERFWKS